MRTPLKASRSGLCFVHTIFINFIELFSIGFCIFDFTINEFVCYNETKQRENWKICEISKPLSLLTLFHCHYLVCHTLPIDSTFVVVGLVTFPTLYFWLHTWRWPVCFSMQMNPMPFLSNFIISKCQKERTKGCYNVFTIKKV